MAGSERGVRTAEHPHRLRGRPQVRAEAEASEDRTAAAAHWRAQPADLRVSASATSWLGGLVWRRARIGCAARRSGPGADGSYCGWAPAPLPRRPALQLRPARPRPGSARPRPPSEGAAAAWAAPRAMRRRRQPLRPASR